MKKLFTLLSAALLALSAFALDGVNVMASGLKATYNDDLTQMTIDYSLNTAATSIEIEFFDANQDIVALVTLTDAELLTAGAHQTTIDVPIEDLEDGKYTWAMHAYAGTTIFENKLSMDDMRYHYYLPQDVVVDNSFESPYFGRVYVSEPYDGASDGGTDATKAQIRGIYIYDNQMNFVNGQDTALIGYDGGLGGNHNTRDELKRLTIDENGYVYVSTGSNNAPGVYRMDPAHPEDPFTLILSTQSNVNALEINGNKLYTIEGGIASADPQVYCETFNTYVMSSIPVDSLKETKAAGEYTLANPDVSIRRDNRGGLWIAQHRYSCDDHNALTHLNKRGDIDFQIGSGENVDLLSNSDGGLSYRGTMGVSADGNMIAIGSNRRAVVFTVAWDESGVPSLTKLCETPKIGGNIDGIAFDVADNMYVASASAEEFHLYPIAKEEGSNHCRVFAPSKYGFEIGTAPATIEQLYITGNIVGNVWNAEEPIEMTAKGEQVFETTATFEAADLAYFALATEKGSWDAFNGSRFGATPNNATVTADAPVALTSGGDGACITIAPGTYNIKADMAAMQLSVEVINAIDSTHPQRTTDKHLTNGQIIIIRDGIQYNLLGTQLK